MTPNHDDEREGVTPWLSPQVTAETPTSDPAAILAASPRFAARVAAAQDRVANWLTQRGGWVAWSGGKDSSAVAALAVSVKPDVPIVHFASGLDFPETDQYLHETAAQQGWNFHQFRVGSAIDAMRAHGNWAHDDPEVDIDEAKAHYWWVIVEGPHQMAVERFGHAMIMGLRADESVKRRQILSKTSVVKLGNGTWSYCPLAHWSGRDTHAVAAYFGIPPNPLYRKMAEMGVPEKSRRVGLVVGTEAAYLGRLVWVRHGWPDLWDKCCEILPRLREKAG